MAVSSLSKITLITSNRRKDDLLKALQSVKKIQLEELTKTEILEEFRLIKPEKAENSEEYKYLISRINQSIDFIDTNSTSSKKKSYLERKSLDLYALENSFSEDQLLSSLKRIEALKKRWEILHEEIERWKEIEEWANIWYRLDASPASIKSDKVTLLMGEIHEDLWNDFASKMKVSMDVVLEEINTVDSVRYFSCLSLKSQKITLDTLISENSVKVVDNSYQDSPEKMKNKSEVKLGTFYKQRKILLKMIDKASISVSSLQLDEEILLAKLIREEAKIKLSGNEQLVVINGWIDHEEELDLVSTLNELLGDNEVYFNFEKPLEKEILDNKVPTKLNNKKFIKPFEILTEMYSVPKYDEIDPTPWMTPFYLVFFGMMVADLGYGFTMLIATTIAKGILKLNPNSQRFASLLQILSLPTIVWGLIYGSFFGASLPIYLLSPTKDFMSIFILALIFGGIQIFTGLIINSKENIRKRDYLSAIGNGFAWQAILSGILIIFAAQIFKIMWVSVMGIGILIVGMISVLVVQMIKGKTRIGGFFMGVYELYGITGYVGDFVSYSRLMALGISGGSIAAAFNTLVDFLPPIAKFSVGIILIIILQGLNLFLSLLSAYIHAARLQYVEFFGKFFEGGGILFKPFKAEEKYLNIEKKIGGNKR